MYNCTGIIICQILNDEFLRILTGFVQTSHNVAKSVLVDAINDKCANCRRQKT